LPGDAKKSRALLLLCLGYVLCVPAAGFLQTGSIVSWSGVGLYLLLVYALFVVVMPVAFLMPAMRILGFTYGWPAVVIAVALYWALLAVLYRRFVRRSSWVCFWAMAGIFLLTAVGVLRATLGAL
jgi:hypothetical protein